ncbi:MAG: alpha/beta hydrolase [Alphaproteobacteria bacterium]
MNPPLVNSPDAAVTGAPAPVAKPAASSARRRVLAFNMDRNALMPMVARVAPGIAARWLERVFLTPQRPNGEARDLAGIGAVPSQIDHAGRNLRVWTLGDGPSVLLVHGWSGYAGQFADIMLGLAQAGFRAVAYDAPAHGKSDGGQTNMVDFAGSILAMARACGPFVAAIAHSFGAPSTILAVERGLQVNRLVVIAPPTSLAQFGRLVARQMGLRPEIGARMQKRIERRIGKNWNELEAEHMIKGLGPRLPPLFIVHDKRDREVPWANGAAVAAVAPEAKFVTTSGLGHTKILKDESVIAQIVGFVGDR